MGVNIVREACGIGVCIVNAVNRKVKAGVICKYSRCNKLACRSSCLVGYSNNRAGSRHFCKCNVCCTVFNSIAAAYAAYCNIARKSVVGADAVGENELCNALVGNCEFNLPVHLACFFVQRAYSRLVNDAALCNKCACSTCESYLVKIERYGIFEISVIEGAQRVNVRSISVDILRIPVVSAVGIRIYDVGSSDGNALIKHAVKVYGVLYI